MRVKYFIEKLLIILQINKKNYFFTLTCVEISKIIKYDWSILFSLFHYVEEGIFADLHFSDRPKFLLSFFIPFKQLSFSGVVSSITFRSYVLFDMGNLRLSYCPCPYPSLYGNSKKLRRDGFLHFLANLLPKLVGPFFMNQKGQCIDWIIHNVNDQLHNRSLLEAVKLVIKRTVSMCNWLEGINKVNNNLRKGQMALNNVLSIVYDCFRYSLSSFRFAKGFYRFIVLAWSYNRC